MFNSFKIRYYEVQENCGGHIKLSASNRSIVISTPNYPNIPPPHIECIWTVLVPSGERVRIDFIERFDVTFGPNCEKEYVELSEGIVGPARSIGTFCREKPTTQKSRSNVMTIKYFTDVLEPKNGFKANVSIDICGGSTKASVGFITSPNYPGLSAYPRKTQCDYRVSGMFHQIFNISIIDIDLPDLNETHCDTEHDHVVIYSVMPDFNGTDVEELSEIGTFCGKDIPESPYSSETNEILIRFITGERLKGLHRGFKIFFNTSIVSCGGDIEGETGIITSPGYPTRALSRSSCEWRVTVPKGRRMKIEFIDADFMKSGNRYQQRVGIYNGFKYSHKIATITNMSSASEPMYSSDNTMMIVMVIQTASSNRGFKLKFSSEESTVCTGNLNEDSGVIIPPPPDMNLTTFTCDYTREVKPIAGLPMNRGTLVYHFKDISIGRKISNCRFASTVLNVKRMSGVGLEEQYLSRICGNSTREITVLSPFPDTGIEIRQSSFFGRINFTMSYKSNKCGGILSKGVNVITNIVRSESNDKVLDCAWFAKYEEGFSVAISIISLKMKLQCDQEYIKIYNGPTSLSPLIGTYCGSDLPKTDLTSQKNTIFIEYHTENFVENSKDSTFELKIQQAAYGCGGILNKFNFWLTTPLYDKPYPSNTECFWEIRADPGYHVGLTFDDRFFLEDSLNCTKDYMEVFDFVMDDWVSLGKRCGKLIIF
jgi:cubilin